MVTKRFLFDLEGVEKNWFCAALRLEIRGMSEVDDRVNQGGLLGRMSSRVIFAAVVMMDARLEKDLLLKREDTVVVKLVLFSGSRRFSQLILVSVLGCLGL